MTDEPAPIVRRREHAVHESEFGVLYDDEVVSPAGEAGTYLRWRWSSDGVVMVGHDPAAGAVLLVRTYRYAPGHSGLELPRGGREPGESGPVAAERELFEETGVRATGSHEIGTLYADSGLIENPLTVVSGEVSPGGAVARPEAFESVGGHEWVPVDELDPLIAAGRLRCAISVAALALWRATGTSG